jgi:hypothetical protein
VRERIRAIDSCEAACLLGLFPDLKIDFTAVILTRLANPAVNGRR